MSFGHLISHIKNDNNKGNSLPYFLPLIKHCPLSESITGHLSPKFGCYGLRPVSAN